MEQLSKAQSLTDIRVRIHSIKADGTDNTDDAANLSTTIKDPSGNTLTPGVDYDEATFTEVGSTGDYDCLFSLAALNPAFTLIDQNNPYRVVLSSSTAGTSTGKDVRIVSKLPGELALEATAQSILTEVLGFVSVVVTSGAGSVLASYAESAGCYLVVKGDGVDVPFRFLGDATGYNVWYSVKKYHEDATFVIGPKVVTGWSAAVEADGNTYTSGSLPHTTAETVDLDDGDYVAELKLYDGVNDPITAWTATLKLRKFVAKKSNLV